MASTSTLEQFNVFFKKYSRLIALAVALVLPLFLSPRWVHTFIIAFYYMMVALSWNLCAGYTGQFSFGHHAFSAVGAYAAGLLAYYYGLPPVAGIIVGGLAAVPIGFVLGGVSLRTRGPYLALTTWAFAECLNIVLRNEYEITGGTKGLLIPTLFPRGTSKLYYYYVGLFLFTVILILVYKLVKSRIGLYMAAIRDDVDVAEAMGVDTVKWKVLVFTFSSFLAGLGGAFYAYYIGLISPSLATMSEMVMIMIIVLFGGMGTLEGTIIGGIFIMLISEFLRGIMPGISLLFFSAVIIILIRFFRGGLIELIRKLIAGFSSSPSVAETEMKNISVEG